MPTKWVFLPLIFSATNARGVLWTTFRGDEGAHFVILFASKFHVTREIVDFRRNLKKNSAKVGRGTVAKILSVVALGSPYSARENLDPTPKIFEN